MANGNTFIQRLKMAATVMRSGGDVFARYFGQRAEAGRPTRSYAQVPAVFACVSVKADALGGLPMMVSTADDQVIESGPLAELAQCPNPGMTGRGFMQTTSALLDLFGVVHWVVEPNAIGQPVEVYPVSTLQMKPNVDRATGKVASWRYRPAGASMAREITIPAELVHSITDTDFDDTNAPWKGLSPRAVLTRQIAQLYKADIANEAILDNGVAPSGAFTTPDNLTEAQRALLRESIDRGHTGSRNRRRYMLLGGGIEWKPTGSNLADMEFLDLKKHNWVEVCAAFRVPPPMVGIYTDSNYAHAEAAKQQFYENAIIPLAERLAEEWTVGILSRFEGDRSLAIANSPVRGMSRVERGCSVYRAGRKAAAKSSRRFFAWLDTSGVAAIRRSRLALADQAMKWNQMGVPLNALTQAYDMPWEEQRWGDTWYKPIGMIDVEEDGAVFDEPPAGEDDLDGLGDDAERGVEQRTAEATKAKLWERWRLSWRGLEKAVQKKVSRHFDELRRQTLASLNAQEAREGGVGVVRRDLVGTVLFNLEAANGQLVARVGKLIRDGYRLGGEQSMQEAAEAQGADKPGTFNIDDPLVERKLRTRLIRITETNRTLRRNLAGSLADGVAAGETTAQLADRIRGEFKIAGNRAGTIARTEVGAAVEEARHVGRRQAGVPLKSWLWSRKRTGRDEHAATERATIGNPIPNDEQFTIAGTGIKCDHPRDITLPAKQSVSCGCTTLARHEGDTIKAVLARYLQRGFLTYEQLVQRDLKRASEN
ncbi:MAG: phage portal protein [Planctomycetota bacterium]